MGYMDITCCDKKPNEQPPTLLSKYLGKLKNKLVRRSYKNFCFSRFKSITFSDQIRKVVKS